MLQEIRLPGNIGTARIVYDFVTPAEELYLSTVSFILLLVVIALSPTESSPMHVHRR